jgi:eukaryotic-like serine/threonine-protein kinase
VVADRYVLRAPIGRGGMGVVWRAHDRLLGRVVVVKEVQLRAMLPQAERRALQARVLREARAAARLNHPGAVTLYDVVQDQGQTFMVMELVEAPTLADLIEEGGPLAPVRVADIGRRLAAVLEAAHRAGIVHRDVKPGNVMVPEDAGVKLADFGVAFLLGDARLTATGLVLGSPSYMAPEQASGQPSGPPADLWGLGATMYAAVEGVPPFDKGALVPTLAAVVTEEPRPMRRAGPLAPVIGALLTKDPAARPSTATLRAWLERPTQRPPATVPLPPVPPPSTPAPAGRRKPFPEDALLDRPRGGRRGRLVGVLGVLVVVAVVLAAWLAGGPGSDPDDRAAPPTTRAAAGATGATRPAPSTTREPAPTREPATTQAPTAPQGGLPAGWRAFTNRAGNHRAGVPPGFQARTRQRYNATVVEEQRDPRRVLTVRSTTPANPLPQASRDYRAWARRNLAGFREVRYAERQTYAGHTGAVVFEYEAVRDGRRVHVRHVNLEAGTWGYNVELIAPVDHWASSQTLARQFEQAFQPLG